MADRLREYKLCKERGHEPSNRRAMSNPPLEICKHCGTYYRWEVSRRLVETMKPEGVDAP